MKNLLNTLYITSPDRYLSLDGENVVVWEERKEIARLPLHNLERIMAFGSAGASPALMEKCVTENRELVFFSRSGKFMARVEGEICGNVLLRREQYRTADNAEKSLLTAKSMIAAKLYNCRWTLERTIRDHSIRVDTDAFTQKSAYLKTASESALAASDKDSLRGIEGEAASVYFSVFNDMILQQKDDFNFTVRSRRPPLDKVNAMLSFAHSLCTSMCCSALESVGLDSYVGFLHTDRPGRRSLALDLVEEFRAPLCDRFVLTCINKRIITKDAFIEQENGAVLLTDDGRREFLKNWQLRKDDEITHPFLKEKVKWGLVPYVQALLLARYLRGDLDGYPPFLWK